MRKIRTPAALLAILLLSAFFRIWISDSTLILLDHDALYHARIAEHIYQDHHIPTWDASELGGIPHYYPPNYHITMVLGKYISPEWSFLAIGSIFTAFCGVLSTLFVYLLGRKFSERVGLASALIYAATPMMAMRSGLWARPTGISMLLTILIAYLFLRTAQGRDRRYALLALIATLSYTFSHSSVMLVLTLIFAASIITKDRYAAKAVLGATLIAFFAGAAYYYRALPFLNFSVSQTGEYMPLTQPLMELQTFGYLENLAEVFLFLGLFNLTLFPVVLHGVYEMLQRKPQLGIIALLSLFTIFFKANMFMLLNFMVCIAIAVSISRISRIGGAPIAALLLLLVLGMDVGLLQMTKGEKKHPNADITMEILTDAPLTSKNTVLAGDPNVGHAIPYYTQASTFLSDLTDTKQYDRNRRVFDTLMDNETGADEAVDLLTQNNIDHLLVFDDSSFPFMKDTEQDFTLVREIQKNGGKAYLYKVKK